MDSDLCLWALRLNLVCTPTGMTTAWLPDARALSDCGRPASGRRPAMANQLDLEQNGGRTFEGVAVRVAQRILAMTAAIWHNRRTSAPVPRSLIAKGRAGPPGNRAEVWVSGPLGSAS